MGAPSGQGVDGRRRATVDRAREEWIRRLIDLSRRNNLLYFRDLKTGTLDLTDHDEAAMEKLRSGETVLLTKLIPNADETASLARAQEIRRRAVINSEEKGLKTLFLAEGMATWSPSDEGRPPQAAVLLVPVEIEARGREGSSLAIRRTGEVQVNPVLLHVMEIDHGLKLSPDLVMGVMDGAENGALDSSAIFGRLASQANNVKGFSIEPRVILGNFSFQKLAMVKDLREQGETLVRHDLIAAIAGDTRARESIRRTHKSIDPRELDQVPPDEEFLVLDADSSQQRVISAVLASQDGVIQGPPGTGKSQTIANLIAEFAARGKRVLFVAEKRAALEVVQRRLRENGLGHLTLDLHGADVSRRELMKQVAESLTLVHESGSVFSEEIHKRFVERRLRLNQHVARLHVRRPPSGLTVYEMQGRILQIPKNACSTTRWRGGELDRLDSSTADTICDLLTEAGGFGGLFLRNDVSPWTNAWLTTGSEVEAAMDVAGRLSRSRYPAIRESLSNTIASTGMRPPTTLGEVEGHLTLLKEIEETLRKYGEMLFLHDLDSIISALSPAKGSKAARVWAWISTPSFRDARRKVIQCRRERRVPVPQLLAEVVSAALQLTRWRELTSPSAFPCLSEGLAETTKYFGDLSSDIGLLGSYLRRNDLMGISLMELEGLLGALASDSSTPHRLPRLLRIEGELAKCGAESIIQELRTWKNPEASIWPEIFQYAWLSSCLDKARTADSALAGFNGRVHDQFVEEFQRLDRERLTLAIARVRRAHAERAVAAMNIHPQQESLVRREAEKKARHLPLRKLLAEAPDVLTALRPCWMASPLSVSQLLGAERQYFDVVLFDEASQVLPEDAVPALLRASRAVVAGDKHQLPPTTFFAAGDEEGEEEETPSEVGGFECILDVMSAFVETWSLDWHYRSWDERLIAFSNRHIYNDRLVTFPGIGGAPALSHALVKQRPGEDGQEESVSAEVDRVVELILEHATKRPDETLGVIAMGIRHSRRVEAALAVAARSRPDLDAFFDQSKEERFFIKNLERVQGDERDAIILTIGYGKDRAGKLPYRFGPLLVEGGERRLNVAISRARRRMTLVSSFDHRDMDPSRSKARGVELLRLYIEMVGSGGRLLGDPGPTGGELNCFEEAVRDALVSKGIPLLPQWGVSSYKIDFVAQHPQRPGRFVLAIECDGATYHSTPTARDRDRLRQQHLEALGWRFHRIWSTDWFMRREEEIERTLAAYSKAVAHAEKADRLRDCRTSSDAVEGEVNPTRANPGVQQRRTQRGPRPPVPSDKGIEEYSMRELVQLVIWIGSDGNLRTDEEIVEEMVQQLGFRRRGSRIEGRIRHAIERARSGPRASS